MRKMMVVAAAGALVIAAGAFVVRAGDQQALVAIGETERVAAPGRQALHSPGARLAGIEPQTEIAGLTGARTDEERDDVGGVRTESRVGMQEQQPGRDARRGTGRKLAPASRCCRHHCSARPARDRDRGVA